ncbi:MAG: carbohydrate ABC transporter permease [Acholeplasmatales bacterium]|nr:carbohydrate ABC transporter permease [Acholeplasmatales bacterium]
MDVEKQISSLRIRKIITLIIIYIFLVIWGIFVLFPFFWMLLTSIRPLAEYNAFPIDLYSKAPTYENYVTAFTADNLLLYMSNTFMYAILTTLIMVVVTTLAAFAFARLKFKGKNLVFTIFLAMMMIPNELVIITNYYTVVNLNLRNSFVGLIMPTVLSVFYIYLLRQNFMQVPDSMYMAAKVDGTSDFGYLTKILIPLSKPTIITITILKLIECWNTYVWPRLVSTKKEYYLISNAIQEIRENGMGRDNIPAMMAAVVCVSIPLIILFIVFRKEIMSGVAKTGTKG